MRRIVGLRAAAITSSVALIAACSDGAATTQPVLAPASSPQAAVVLGDELHGRDDVRIVAASGDITAAVGEFRGLLGMLNQNVAGEQPGNRREINWDGVPIGVTNTDAFPGTFFNVNSPRGIVFTTDGTGFRISDNGYFDVNPAYAGEFVPFSPKKLFVAVGSTTIDAQFFVAGSNTPATVTGFGAVFEDVGRAHSTTIQYFDANGNSLLEIAAPRRSDETGLSFVGAVFDSRIVARVRILAGDTPIGEANFDNVKGAGQKHDIVATDDFIYGEPRAIN